MRRFLYYLSLLLVLIGSLNYASKAFGVDVLNNTLGKIADGKLIKGVYILIALAALYISYDIVKNREWFDLYLKATGTLY